MLQINVPIHAFYLYRILIACDLDHFLVYQVSMVLVTCVLSKQKEKKLNNIILLPKEGYNWHSEICG